MLRFSKIRSIKEGTIVRVFAEVDEAPFLREKVLFLIFIEIKMLIDYLYLRLCNTD